MLTVLRRKTYPRPSPRQSTVEARSLLRFAGVAAALSLVPLVMFFVMWVPERRLAASPRAVAEVIEVTHVRRTSKGPPETTSARVRFTTDEGRAVETTLRTTRRALPDRVSLSYDPQSPTRVRAVEGAEHAWRVPLILAATLGWLASLGGWMALRLRMGHPSRTYLKSRQSQPDDIQPE